MDNWDPFASSERKSQTPSISISDLSWPPMDSATSEPNAPPASASIEAGTGAFDWPDLSASSSASLTGQDM